MHKVTARWIGASLTGLDGIHDIVEVDHKLYFYTDPKWSNDDLEAAWNSFGYIGGSTIEEIEESKDALGVLRVIRNRSPDWIYAKPVCECGGEKLKMPHSCWCPKYE